MRIVSSAIKFKETPYSQYWHIICGKRHCNCFETMFKHQFSHDRNSEIQGFLTDTNQFVDRYEAAEIAYEAKQISEPLSILYSEDVWPE